MIRLELFGHNQDKIRSAFMDNYNIRNFSFIEDGEIKVELDNHLESLKIPTLEKLIQSLINDYVSKLGDKK